MADGVNILPRFDCTHTKSQAIAAKNNEPETVFFTTIDHKIIKNGAEFGGTTDHENRITTLESQVPTASSAASAAEASAASAAGSAADVQRDVSNLYAMIGSLPDGQAVSAQVAAIAAAKVTEWHSTPNDDSYPSEKLVKDAIDDITPEYLSDSEIEEMWNSWVSGNEISGGSGGSGSGSGSGSQGGYYGTSYQILGNL